MKVTVYGPGCVNCNKTVEVVQKVIDRLDASAELEKVTDLRAIVEAGVMGTPAVAVDGVMKVSGRVPREQEIESWLQK